MKPSKGKQSQRKARNMSLDLLKGPIPGQSLTVAMGSHPWHNPPQYTDLNDALEHVFNALTSPRQVVRLVLLLKKGTPVEYIARTVLFIGFSKGMWTPDLALLMLKTTMAMIIGIAHIKKVKVKIFNPDKEQDKFLDTFLDLVGGQDQQDDKSGLTEQASASGNPQGQPQGGQNPLAGGGGLLGQGVPS